MCSLSAILPGLLHKLKSHKPGAQLAQEQGKEDREDEIDAILEDDALMSRANDESQQRQRRNRSDQLPGSREGDGLGVSRRLAKHA